MGPSFLLGISISMSELECKFTISYDRSYFLACFYVCGNTYEMIHESSISDRIVLECPSFFITLMLVGLKDWVESGLLMFDIFVCYVLNLRQWFSKWFFSSFVFLVHMKILLPCAQFCLCFMEHDKLHNIYK